MSGIEIQTAELLVESILKTCVESVASSPKHLLRRSRRCSVFSLPGRMTEFYSANYKGVLADIEFEENHAYIFDFRRLQQIDSFGINLLGNFGHKSNEYGSKSYAAWAKPSIRSDIEVTVSRNILRFISSSEYYILTTR